MTILVKEHVEKILAYTKIRRRQAHESNRQIQEATLRTALQDAQRADRAQALPSRGGNAGSIVGQHGIGADRQGERDCCSFAGIEPGKRRVRGNGRLSCEQSRRPRGDPRLDERWCPWLTQLVLRLVRDQDLVQQLGQHADLADQDEVAQRAAVRDGPHRLQAELVEILALARKLCQGRAVVDAVLFQKGIQFEARRHAEQLA
jgi:hypothetical protein